MSKIRKKWKRNRGIEEKYLHEISQFTEIPVDKVKEVFKYYRLLLLFDIATRKEPKGSINISLPFFSTFRLKPYKNKDGNDYLSIGIDQMVKHDYLKTPLEEAYFNNKNYLLEYLIDRYGHELLVEMNNILGDDING